MKKGYERVTNNSFEMNDIEFDSFKAQLLSPSLEKLSPENAQSEVAASRLLSDGAMQEQVVARRFRHCRMFPTWFGRYKAFVLSRSRGYQCKSLSDGK